MDEDRRRLVRTLGLTALGGLAGCQESTTGTDSDPTDSETPATVTDAPSTTEGTRTEKETSSGPAVTVDVAVTRDDSTPVVEVTGTATADAPIVAIEVTVGDQTATQSAPEETSVEFAGPVRVMPAMNRRIP